MDVVVFDKTLVVYVGGRIDAGTIYEATLLPGGAVKRARMSRKRRHKSCVEMART
jgi:hypothetical protein